MKRPKISVVIPAYNAQSTIGKCLQALEKQTLKPVEVIVIDDGSTDNSKLKIKKAKLQFKIKNLILLEQNHQGAAKARNLGVQRAKGEILAFTDADCIPPRDWLAKIALAFSDPKVGAAGGGYSSGLDDSFWQRFSHEELFYRRQERERLVTTLVANNMVCRKACFLQARGFPEQYPVCEDMLLSYKISRKHKVLWLKDNGVQHHFKRTLKEFLKHQYFFGKESTRFFLENPSLLSKGHHQGKTLHLAILISFLSFVNLLSAVALLISGNFLVGKTLLGVSIIMFLAHFLLYLRFIFHLQNKGFSGLNTIKAYFASLLRDLVSAFSFFDGFAHAFKTQRERAQHSPSVEEA